MSVSSREGLIERLRGAYTLVPRNSTSYLITHAGADEIDGAIQLELDQDLLERYLDALIGTQVAGDRQSAIGLVKIYVDETVQSALTMGQTVRVMGLRKNRRSRQPEWFVDQSAP